MSAEYIALNNKDLRDIFKKETGIAYGSPVNNRDHNLHFFNDEYIEWLEATILAVENNGRLMQSLSQTKAGGES